VICYLDTQVAVWLCQKQLDRLSRKATEALEESELLISPMVLLELAYLYEIQRIVQPPQILLKQLESQIGLRVCDHSFPAVVETALYETWTRDPFDRLIVAHARSNGYSPLATSDARIHEHYPNAIW
jgi:PIN domain nuclease of toxin-antitoxin system